MMKRMDTLEYRFLTMKEKKKKKKNQTLNSKIAISVGGAG